jgi:hypothetical protein
MYLDGSFEYCEEYVFDISGTVEEAEPATETYPGSQADIVDINVKWRAVDVTEVFENTDYWGCIRDELFDSIPDDEPDHRDFDAERSVK